MIFTRLFGGLGNQMFQYAFARAIADRTNSKVYLDRYGFWKSRYNHGEFLGDRMLLNDQCVKMIDRVMLSHAFRFCLRTGGWISRHSKADSEQKRFMGKTKFGLYQTHSTEQIGKDLEEILVRRKIMMIDGYFQWPRMFDAIKEQLSKELTLTEEALEKMSQDNRDILQELDETESVCIHIRRGDYLNYPAIQVCNYKYYREAMNLISEQHFSARFYIFSDDIQWVEDHYDFPESVRFVEGKCPASIEWYLMKNSKHFVISNSSFSWWAQYLSMHPKKMVIAPYPWFNDGRKVELHLDDFHLLQPTGGTDR